MIAMVDIASGRRPPRHRAEAVRQEELAEDHEEAAAIAEERAEEIEERIPREGKGAAFHDERAAEIEEKL
jgi:hypothetical protein